MRVIVWKDEEGDGPEDAKPETHGVAQTIPPASSERCRLSATAR